MGGAISRAGNEETAFSYRDALCVMNIVTKWIDPAESGDHIQWTREFAEAFKSFSAGVYVNFLGEEGEERVKEAYRSETLRRLVELKNRYDPSNFFRMNQNIRPAL
jgi:FAD/FMN-containing dehydrogenase